MIDWLQPFFPALNLSIIAVYVVLLLVILAFFREWTPPDVVALSALGILMLLGVLPLNDIVENGKILERGILSVFSNGAPITVACMFILSAGLERTGVIDAMGKFFSRVAGKSELRVLLVMMCMVALLSASGAMSETIPPSLVLITIGAVTGV